MQSQMGGAVRIIVKEAAERCVKLLPCQRVFYVTLQGCLGKGLGLWLGYSKEDNTVGSVTDTVADYWVKDGRHRICDDSPAKKAGIMEGDLIVSVDGETDIKKQFYYQWFPSTDIYGSRDKHVLAILGSLFQDLRRPQF